MGNHLPRSRALVCVREVPRQKNSEDGRPLLRMTRLCRGSFACIHSDSSSEVAQISRSPLRLSALYWTNKKTRMGNEKHRF